LETVLVLPDDEDLTPLLEQYDGQTFDVKLRDRRLFKDGNWNTLCLPFTSNLTAPLFTNAQEYTIMELDVTRTYYLKDDNEREKPYKTGVQDGTLYIFFKEAKSISAGTPYIVKWKEVENYNSLDPAFDYQDPVFADMTISKALQPVSSNDGKLTFQPTYAPIVWGKEDRSILFLGISNMLYYPNGAGNVSMNSCRAYFKLKDGIEMGDPDSGGSGGGDEFIPIGGGDVKAFVVNISDGETRITATNLTNQTNMADAWYTIDGRKLDKKPAQRGLYISNGRKLVIK
jgi:hypothetical protein